MRGGRTRTVTMVMHTITDVPSTPLGTTTTYHADDLPLARHVRHVSPYLALSNHALAYRPCTQAFKWTNETDAVGCCATCAATPKCQAWEFTTTATGKKGNCHIKDSMGPVKYQLGTTCGTHGTVPPVPGPPAPLPPAPPAPKGSPNIVWFLTGG